MGFTEVLTIVFIVLKLIGVIKWTWWLVLLPEIIAVFIYVIWFLVVTIFIGKTQSEIRKSFKNDFWK